MNDKILYGKKVILFEFTPADMDGLVKLLRGDKKGYMGKYCLKEMTEDEAKNYIKLLIITGQIKLWSVYVKHIKHPKPIGFAALSNFTPFSATMMGIMDSDIVRGLGKKIREGKYTYSEDTSRTLINHCFNGVGLNRLETSMVEGNSRSLLLIKKTGWKQEGVARKAFRLNDNEYKNLINFSILKEEWKNG